MPKRKFEDDDTSDSKPKTARERRQVQKERAREWARHDALITDKVGGGVTSAAARNAASARLAESGKATAVSTPPKRGRGRPPKSKTARKQKTVVSSPPPPPEETSARRAHEEEEKEEEDESPEIQAPPAKKRVKLNSGQAASTKKLTKKERLAEGRAKAAKAMAEKGTPKTKAKEDTAVSSPSPAAAVESKTKAANYTSSPPVSPPPIQQGAAAAATASVAAPPQPVVPSAAAPAATFHHEPAGVPGIGFTNADQQTLAEAQLENLRYQQYRQMAVAAAAFRLQQLSPEEQQAYLQQRMAFGAPQHFPPNYPYTPAGEMYSPQAEYAGNMQSPPASTGARGTPSGGGVPVSATATAPILSPPPAHAPPSRPTPSRTTAQEASSSSSSRTPTGLRGTKPKGASISARNSRTAARRQVKTERTTNTETSTAPRTAPSATRSEQADSTFVHQDDVEQEGAEVKTFHFLPGGLWNLLIPLFVVVIVSFVVFLMGEETNVRGANEQVEVWLPPCYVSRPFEEDQIFKNCDGSKGRLSCPEGGVCKGGELKSCLDSYHQVSKMRDACILSAATNETLAKVEALLAKRTVEHTCSLAGCAHAIDKPDTKAPFFDVSEVQEKIDVDEKVLSLSDSLVLLSGKDETIIGLTDEYMDNELIVPLWCYIGLLAVGGFELVVSSVIYIGTLATGLAYNITISYPLASAALILTIWAIYAVRKKRHNNKQLGQDVANARELTYSVLMEDRKQEHIVLHMRDMVAADLYPDSKSKRAYVVKKVWPRVVVDVNHDNRVAKVTRMDQGYPREAWQWTASTTSGKKKKRART